MSTNSTTTPSSLAAVIEEAAGEIKFVGRQDYCDQEIAKEIITRHLAPIIGEVREDNRKFAEAIVAAEWNARGQHHEERCPFCWEPQPPWSGSKGHTDECITHRARAALSLLDGEKPESTDTHTD